MYKFVWERVPHCSCRITTDTDGFVIATNAAECIVHGAKGKREYELAQEIERLRRALGVYAEPKNWKCARCGRYDPLNCFNSRFDGPLLGDPEADGEDQMYNDDYQPWALAAEAL